MSMTAGDGRPMAIGADHGRGSGPSKVAAPLMRIAVISTPFIRVPPDGYGGTELFCANLVSELVDRGHRVTLFATGDSVSSAEVKALYPRGEWPPSPSHEVAHVKWAFEQISRASEPYDIVQANSPNALLFAQELPMPLVYTIHHARAPHLSAIYAHEPRAHYVAISERQLRLEVPLLSASVIHHGLDPEQYPPSFKAGRSVLHIGRFAFEKGTDIAIDAARRAGVPIRLAGRCHPPDREYFDTEVVPRLSGHSGVELCGEANHERKVVLLRNARALLCPIRWEEPFGLIAIEAMLCGTPVIGFGRGSFPEIIDDNVTGFLVSDADELVEAIRRVDRLDRRECARHARRRFSAARMAAEYEALFESLLGGVAASSASGGASDADAPA